MFSQFDASLFSNISRPVTYGRTFALDNFAVIYSTTPNIYRYDNLNLLIYYGIAIFLTAAAMVLRLYPLLKNRVARTITFNSVIVTTWSAKLYELSKGQSLGALPVEKTVERVMIKFWEFYKEPKAVAPHTSFRH